MRDRKSLLTGRLALFANGRVLFCLFAVALLLGLTPQARAQVVLNPANGHYYEAVFVSGGINWNDARDAAASRAHLGLKGHLATITSAAEDQFIVANLPSAVNGDYWLGGYQDHNAPDYSEPAGGWRWVTGEPWSYTDWAPNQPDNDITEDYLQFFTSNGGWNDGNGSFLVAGYMVEYEYFALPFDINGDGQSDLVFQNSTTGQIVFWYMNGTRVIGGAAASLIPASGYKIQGTGDFNGDGNPDLVFQNSTTGQIVIWYLSGTNVLGGSSVSLVPLPGYQVVGVGDFNSDGFPDIVLQNTTTNKVVIWYMNGATVTSGSFISLTPAAGYQVVGVNDFNADGSPDLVLQNGTTGQIVIWYMNGINVTGGVSLPTPLSGYKVAGVSAFNVSLPGLVLQNSVTNQVVFWYISGANVAGGGFASGIPNSAYQIAGRAEALINRSVVQECICIRGNALRTGRVALIEQEKIVNCVVFKSLMVLMVAWAMCTAPVAFAQAPVSWWSGDGNANDSIGGNNGVLNGGVTYAPGFVNQAFNFDGTNGVVLIPDADNLKITGSLSISTYINIAGISSIGSDGKIVFRGDNRTGLDPYWIAIRSDGRLVWHIADNLGNTSEISAPVAMGRFVAVLATLNDATGEMRLYLDGQLSASGTTTLRPFRDLDPTLNPGVSIGNTSYTLTRNEPFNGLIDEVKIYNTVITPLPGKADFNGDGHDDLLFQNSATGQVVFWFMNGTNVTGGASLALTPAAGYKVCGTGDFNQDGYPDLVFQNSATGQIAIWFMSGTNFIGGASVALIPLPEYQVVGVGDFNGDGLPDIVLQSKNTGKVVIWFMNGTTVTGGSLISLTPATGYSVVGVYDMNGDGHPDLILQQPQPGRIAIWYMNGITVTGGVSLPLPAPSYKVAGAGAFNGSLPGLALQSGLTNQIVLWYISGANVVGGGFASGIPDSSYPLVGPR